MLAPAAHDFSLLLDATHQVGYDTARVRVNNFQRRMSFEHAAQDQLHHREGWSYLERNRMLARGRAFEPGRLLNHPDYIEYPIPSRLPLGEFLVEAYPDRAVNFLLLAGFHEGLVSTKLRMVDDAKNDADEKAEGHKKGEEVVARFPEAAWCAYMLVNIPVDMGLIGHGRFIPCNCGDGRQIRG